MSQASSRRRSVPMATRHLRSLPGRGIALYEALKSAWVSTHPNASSVEYDAAMLRFARLSGV